MHTGTGKKPVKKKKSTTKARNIRIAQGASMPTRRRVEMPLGK